MENSGTSSTLQAFGDFGEGMTEVPFPKLLAEIPAQLLHTWIIDQLSHIGKTWDAKNPFIDAQIRHRNMVLRLHVAFGHATRSGTLVSLRKLALFSANNFSRELRWEKDPKFSALKKAVLAHETILIAGATGSGKTTLLSELLTFAAPQERILTLEDTPELQIQHPHCIGLISRPANSDGYGEIHLRRLVKESLRMRPDRIILGECRGEEVLDLLQCLNTGHTGSLGTLHANSCRDALRRLELLCLLASQGKIPISVIRDLIVSGIQWIAHVRRENGTRRVTELTRIAGKEGDALLLRPHL